MKLNYSSLIVVVLLIFVNVKVFAQDDAVYFEPKYITVTLLHGVDGVNFEEWKAVEQEYFDKVTSKVDIILKHEVLLGYFSNNLRDILVINVFNSWNDIQHVNNVRDELIAKAWPDEEARKLFFEKQNSFYTNYHSDEIYFSTSLEKPLSKDYKKDLNKPLVYYMDTNILSDSDNESSFELYKKYVREVINKNPLIKAYTPHKHFWGADSREFVEVFVVESLADLEKALDKNKELLAELVPDKEKRKDFLKIYALAVSGHKEAIYVNVPSLSK